MTRNSLLICMALAFCACAPKTESSPSDSAPTPSRNTTRKQNPKSLEVPGRFIGRPGFNTIDKDDGSISYSMMETVEPKTWDIPSRDSLSLGLASNYEITFPEIGKCQITLFDFPVFGPQNNILQLEGIDGGQSGPCLEFFSQIRKHGLKIRFLQVPLKNVGTIYEKVDIDLSGEFPR